ncbi:MAG: hypothetical protein KatS3mg010_2070 [Acidimicrobiia bacterium]|nr:MAG: hypothetical protein KatS3mg010_2070 [Acidimicrobiia bacterium]
MTANPTRTYRVVGMTCGHCVSSVRSEVAKVPGVEQLDVDLESGLLTLTGRAEVADEDVRAAVEEAGYEIEMRGAATDPHTD